jgi:ATP phosphoribosyltransferase
MSTILRLALQRSGRLSEESITLIREAGIHVEGGRGNVKLRSEAHNFPLEIFFLRDDDIPRYVADGVADIGIVGENTVLEEERAVVIRERLGFAKCRLSVAVPKFEPYFGAKDLNGKSIATSYPNLLKKFLDSHNVTAEIHEISGSVEIAPGIGLSNAVCDLVGTGSTLWTNGLREVETVLQSEAVMIAPEKGLSREAEDLLQKMLFRIRSVLRAKQYKYILLNAPNESVERIVEILPGVKSPTIVPLALEGWCSIHSVLKEDDFWESIESLRAAGAQGILVAPIEKIIV